MYVSEWHVSVRSHKTNAKNENKLSFDVCRLSVNVPLSLLKLHLLGARFSTV